MCEYEETMQRLAACGIKATVQFFGSARAIDRNEYDMKHYELTTKLKQMSPGSSEHAKAKDALEKLEAMEWMIEYLDKTREVRTTQTAPRLSL